MFSQKLGLAFAGWGWGVPKVSKQAAALSGAFGALSGLPDKTQDPQCHANFG